MTGENPAEHEVAVVGGSPAGQTAPLYSTRLGHPTVLLGRGGGRAAMMREVHNLVDVREETSGNEYLGTGEEQLRGYDCNLERAVINARVILPGKKSPRTCRRVARDIGCGYSTKCLMGPPRFELRSDAPHAPRIPLPHGPAG